jgi:hypothetical protein
MVSGARGRRATSVDVEPVAARSLKALLSHTITGCRKPTTLIYAMRSQFYGAVRHWPNFAILEVTTTI